MKRCPECRTKNDDASHFCEKCGLLLAGAVFQEKGERHLGKRKKTPSLLIVFIVAVMVLGGVAFWIIEAKPTANPRIAWQPKVFERVDYSGQTVSMADVVAKVKDGRISIPLDLVRQKKIVRFEYANNGIRIPLLAYVTLSGRVVTAISMCEPCRASRFHIRDKVLVCDACNTEWNLDTLKGVSGDCMNSPPEVIPSTVEKESVLIQEKSVLGWKPRT